MRKLFFSENEGDKNLSVLNGIRVLAICYVVFGHAYIMGVLQPSSNNSSETQNKLMRPFLFAIVPGAFYAVDVFFFLSGFFAVYTMLTKYYTNKGRAPWHIVFFHRYYRLTITIGLLIGFIINIFKFLGSGPMWSNNEPLVEDCINNWWASILYI